jgi:hypothetical protein
LLTFPSARTIARVESSADAGEKGCTANIWLGSSRDREYLLAEAPDGAGSVKLGKCSTLILLSFNEQAEK